MCKIFIQTNINDNNREKSLDLIQAMSEVMSEDVSHQDGLGYAAIDTNGELFAERWLNNHDAFDIRNPHSKKDKAILDEYNGFLSKDEDYNSYGNINLENIASITLHTRLATSAKGLLNTHPFIDGNTSLIHNGVISNHTKFEKNYSTCDSEVILTEYVRNGVMNDIKYFNGVSEQLDGYYACGVFTINSNEQRVLDIFKSSSAQLVAGYVKELDCLVFTSLESQLLDGLEIAGLTLGGLFKVSSNTIVRLNPFNGKVLDVATFSEKKEYGNSYYDSGLGYDRESYYNKPVSSNEATLAKIVNSKPIHNIGKKQKKKHKQARSTSHIVDRNDMPVSSNLYNDVEEFDDYEYANVMAKTYANAKGR